MILYLDCSSGISGDMLVSALLSLAGVKPNDPGALDEWVRPTLRAAGIDPRLAHIETLRRGGLEALSFTVSDAPGFATFDELIVSMYASSVDQAIADAVAGVAQRLAAAERAVHGEDEPRLHELGTIDTAVDLLSAATLLHRIAPACVVALPPALGSGTVETAHGELEVPVPAVRAVLEGLPTADGPETDGEPVGELTTPTGAALLAHYATAYGPQPAGPVVRSGFGAGQRNIPSQPNVLRVVLIDAKAADLDMSQYLTPEPYRPGRVPVVAGVPDAVTASDGGPHVGDEAAAPAGAADAPAGDEPVAAAEAAPPEPGETLAEPAPGETGEAPEDSEAGEAAASGGHGPGPHVLLETNIDDMTPELLAHAADALREAGAVDVWMTQALMKKGRPGVVLHVLAAAADRERLAALVFAETSSFGLRVLPVDRIYADERRETVRIGGHEISVRLGYVSGRVVTVSPEFEDCRRVAAAVGRPARIVYEAAQTAARARFSGS